MIFIASYLPIENILGKTKNKTHEEILTFLDTMDYFCFSDCTIERYKLDDMLSRLTLYPLFYTEDLYIYKIQNNYYHKVLGGFLNPSCALINMKRIPEYFGTEEKYPRIKNEERIWDAFDENYLIELKKNLSSLKFKESKIHCIHIRKK